MGRLPGKMTGNTDKSIGICGGEGRYANQSVFLNGDMHGAIAYMREHEEFQDILPAYIAIFENCKYRTYDVPEFLNQILLLYQVYYRDVFYCGLLET